MTSTGVQNKVQNMIFSSYFTLSDTSHFLPLTQSDLVTKKLITFLFDVMIFGVGKEHQDTKQLNSSKKLDLSKILSLIVNWTQV